MNRIYFATTNKSKFNSVSKLLSQYKIAAIHFPLELPEPQSDDLRKIAGEKILYAYEKIKKPCIALDSGFYIHSLNGFPKTFAKFVIETLGVNGIIKLVEEKPRKCEFRNCLAYMDETLSEPAYFESKIEGRLSNSPIGEMQDYYWSRLSLIFIPKNEKKTLAEMTFDEYQNWRNRKYKKFAAKFAEFISQR